MKFSMFSIAACGMLFLSAGAQAATVYDESVSGDADAALFGLTDLGTLTSGTTSTILGSYDAGTSTAFGDGPDEQDSYTFTTLQSFTVGATTLSGDDALYSLWMPPASSPLNFSGPAPDMFGTFGAGTYSVALVGLLNVGAGSYKININVVPLPASVPLLLSGLGALGLLRRRRNRKA